MNSRLFGLWCMGLATKNRAQKPRSTVACKCLIQRVSKRVSQIAQKHMFSRSNCTGLFRCYISRVENGHTVPELPPFTPSQVVPDLWGSSGKDAHLLAQFRQSLRNIKARDRTLLLLM